MSGEWEGAFWGTQFEMMFPFDMDFELMTVDSLNNRAIDLLTQGHVEPQWQALPFHRQLLQGIVDTSRQRQFLKACYDLAEKSYFERVVDKKCCVKHHAVRVTASDIQLVEKEYFYGSCPNCFAAGPMGKGCQNQHCTGASRFISIYARDYDKNPGSAIHRSVIACAPIMVLYDDSDANDFGIYTPDMQTCWFQPMNLLARASRAGSEIFTFDEDVAAREFAAAIGVATADAVQLLRTQQGIIDRNT